MDAEKTRLLECVVIEQARLSSDLVLKNGGHSIVVDNVL
jgi:hypothetical protein